MKINAEQYIKADSEERGKILAKSYGLSAHQMWKHQQSGKWIISHAGIQSIAAQEDILVDYEVIAAAEGFAIIKANIKDGQSTFGEATKANCKMAYYVAMAEKRAFDRAVLIHILRHVGGYGADFYGEDEADEFKRADNKSKPAGNKSKANEPTVGELASALNAATSMTEVKGIWAQVEKMSMSDDDRAYLTDLGSKAKKRIQETDAA
jgi:hypothetical protein